MSGEKTKPTGNRVSQMAPAKLACKSIEYNSNVTKLSSINLSSKSLLEFKITRKA